MGLEKIIRGLKQVFNPLTLTMESPLILKFLVNSIKAIKNPQEVKSHDRLLEKIDFNDPLHDAKQNPVLLVPGYLEDPTIYYNHLDDLRKYGIRHAYWVPLYPFKSIEENSSILLNITHDVLSRTNRKKCNYIGHSMGGLVVYYTAMHNSELIDKAIAIGSPGNGTEAASVAYEFFKILVGNDGVSSLEERGYRFDALRQMFYGSEFVKGLRLNNDVDYYSIFSENDEVILPWESAFIKGATNINVNKHLNLDYTGHIRLVYRNKVRESVCEILNNALDKERFMKAA